MNSPLSFNEWTEYVKFGSKYEPTPESTRFVEKYIDGQAIMLAGGTQKQEQILEDHNPSIARKIEIKLNALFARIKK